jgi:SAM and SH3 domain-containing protein 1
LPFLCSFSIKFLSFFFLACNHTQKGDIIDVLSMNASGVWKGCLNGRVGHFKFINVEVMPELKGGSGCGGGGKAMNNKIDRTRNACPSTVDELLSRIGLKEYTSVFVLNG